VLVTLEQLVNVGFCGTVILSCADCPLLCSVAISVWELPIAQFAATLIVTSNVPLLLTATFVPAEGAVAWEATSENAATAYGACRLADLSVLAMVAGCPSAVILIVPPEEKLLP